MRFSYFAAVFCALALGTSVAQASVVQTVYSGTINDSVDNTNTFGLGGGASLDGQSFTLTATYDTSVGILDNADPAFAQVYGGTFWGAAPPASLSLTINGITLVFNGTLESFASVCDVSQCVDYVHDAYAADESGVPADGGNFLSDEIYAAVYSPKGTFPVDLESAFDIAAQEVTDFLGYFHYTACVWDAEAQACGRTSIDVAGNLVLSGTSSPGASPVPLPAGVWLLGSGLAAIGALRRRKAKAA